MVVNPWKCVFSFAWAPLIDQESGSQLKVTYITITSDVIFSLTCNYIPGAHRKQHCRSAWCTLHIIHHIVASKWIPKVFWNVCYSPCCPRWAHSPAGPLPSCHRAFGGNDRLHSVKYNVSLNLRIEQMMTSIQFLGCISDWIILPGNERGFVHQYNYRSPNDISRY